MTHAGAHPTGGTAAAHDDEEALWAAYKTEGSTSAREQLFSRYSSFARSIAARHHREQSLRDTEFTDLRQFAYAGLLEALDRFDPQQGTPFRAFAAHRISGSVRDGMMHMSEVREQISWRHRANRERLQSLARENADELNTSQAMDALAELAVGLALGFMLEGTGLFTQGDEDSGAQSALVTAYDSLAWKDMVRQLQTELSLLPEREQTILRRHYSEGMNFDDLASLLAVTKGRVSQLHRSALLRLRKRMSRRGHFRLEE